MSARSAYDVLVAGGGTAGLAAACSAADLGARTLLVERAQLLGGNATLAWVHTICGLYLSAERGDAVPVNSGFPLRLARALRAAGGAGEPERAGRVWVLPTFPPVLEGVAARACGARSSLECWLGAEVVSATLSRGGLEPALLEVASGSTLRRVEARVVVDATGDGAVGALAGASTDREPAERLQAPSFIFRVQGAPSQELCGFGRVRWSVALVEAARRGALPPGCESVLVRPGRKAGEAYVTLNLPRLPGRSFDPLDEAYLEDLRTQARDWARAIVAFLRETRPSFAHCTLEGFARRVGVRETRRLRGLSVVERDDVLRGRRCDDEVALSSWPIELWHDHLRARFEYGEGPCGIPLGALVSASHARLGMAGRCLSASHEALGAARNRDRARYGRGDWHRGSPGCGSRDRAWGRIAGTGAWCEGAALREGRALVTVVDLVREAARTRPDAPALFIAGGEGKPDERVSYAALVQRFDAIGQRLQALGVAKGDRCGLVAKQGLPFVETALGILAAGGCLAPIPEDTAPRARAAQCAEAHLHHLFEARGVLSSTPLPNFGPVDGRGDEEFRALRPAYLRFTSGTTSRRKGVILGHAAILARLEHANRGLAIGPDDRVMWLLPMAHHFVVSILLYLSRGACVCLPSSSLARPVLELSRRAGATFFYASPFHYNLLAKDTSGAELASVRLAVSTAEGLREGVAEAFQKRYGRPLVQALGIIEVGLPVMNLVAAGRKPEALGRPLLGYEVWLRGEDGTPLVRTSQDQTGEICIRGPGMLDAYLSPWTLARELLEPDGFRTGDQGWFDLDGDLHLAGRRANRINLAGMKFFCEEVEAVLEQHPGVRRSRVSARCHPHLGDIPVAEIEARDPAAPPSRAELMALCRERLAGYKIPREFTFVEKLPTTSSDKVVRWGA